VMNSKKGSMFDIHADYSAASLEVRTAYKYPPLSSSYTLYPPFNPPFWASLRSSILNLSTNTPNMCRGNLQCFVHFYSTTFHWRTIFLLPLSTFLVFFLLSFPAVFSCFLFLTSFFYSINLFYFTPK
jgi:hypothetical protein